MPQSYRALGDRHLSISVARKTMGKPWENHGKTMGKPWENGKTMEIIKNIEKMWENHGKTAFSAAI